MRWFPEWISARTGPEMRLCAFFGHGALFLGLFAQLCSVSAQTGAPNRNDQRAQLNDSAVLIIADHPDSTMMKIVDDMAIALGGDEDGFRVVPVVGDGARANVRDVVLLRHIDAGISDLTALQKMRRSRDISQNLPAEISHLVTLFPDKIQILARKTISSIADLDGKRVSVGLKDSSTELHAQSIFDAFRVTPRRVNLAAPDSALALINGEIDAFVCFCLSSPGIYQRVMFNVDLHLLSVPFEGGLQRDYLPATLTHEEFPSFIDKDERIETVGVTLALFTYNWKKGNPRYAKVAKFVERLYRKLPNLQKPPRHPDWNSVQISATASGWDRFPAAAEIQVAQREEALRDMRVAFSEFLNQWTTDTTIEQVSSRPNEQIRLFEEFLQWRQTSQ